MMSGEMKWERLGAATGILFVALLLVSVFMVPAPPAADASTSSIVTYYGDHRSALLVSAYLSGLAGVAFLWFLGSLVMALRRGEGDHARLSLICLVGGACTAAVAFATTGISASLAYGTNIHGDAGAVRALYDLNLIAGVFIAFTLAVFVAAGSIVMIRSGAVSRWLGEAGVVLAIFLLVVGGSFASSGPFAPSGAIGLIGLLAFALWTLIASVRLVMEAMPARASTPAAVPH